MPRFRSIISINLLQMVVEVIVLVVCQLLQRMSQQPAVALVLAVDFLEVERQHPQLVEVVPQVFQLQTDPEPNARSPVDRYLFAAAAAAVKDSSRTPRGENE